MDGNPFRAAALSQVRENSWLGYYIAPAPGQDSATEQTIAMRITRLVGHGLHEEIDPTNYTQSTVEFTLALEVEADFTDQSEIGTGKNTANPTITRDWHSDRSELAWQCRAQHTYDHPDETGTAEFSMSLVLGIAHADSEPRSPTGRSGFAYRWRRAEPGMPV